ncbi:MAG: hypothetical protein ABEH60_06845 [Halonotius sp.]
MNRRQYLGAAAAGVAVGVVGVGGYTLLSEDTGGPPPVTPSEMPYSDASSYELSGTGATNSSPFRLENGGPTIVHADHSDKAGPGVAFTVTLESTTSDTTRPVVQVTGPYVGTVVVRPPAPSGEYELSVSAFGGKEPLSWEATVYDVPVYDDTGLSLPLSYADGLDAVIGPINFGERIPVEASFSIDTDTASSLALINREGESAGTLLNKQLAGSYTQAFRAEGIGYLQIDSNTTWTVSLKEIEESLMEPNETADQSQSTDNTTQTNSTTGSGSTTNTTQTNTTNQSQSTTNTSQTTQTNTTNQSY